MNQNTEYELLVAQIHQGMLQFDGVENIAVKHDVTITGKSGATHQIDVYWEFKLAGVTYRTCIECKNYRSAIKKSQVASFAETLRDIGNANGIIATTSSYQKGAKLLAQANNIRLVLVNNLLTSIHYKILPMQTHFDNVDFNFNRESGKAALERNNIDKFEVAYTYSGEHPLLDSEGNPIGTINSIINSFSLHEGHNVVDCSHLHLDVEGLDLVQLDSISVDVSYSQRTPIEGVVESPHSAKAVIEDIVDNNCHYLHRDGSVTDNINNA
ncbi:MULTISPECIES: restriction endonuclease [Vibrio diabolicus subgroup]|uniref:restriction endonuclease n=1 Tax=Vibrio diabolicus subgroup TaxID=2315253 RepID=UPI00211B28C5|nr:MULTISPECIES: restriction endonuclease [Vibrio diabolicus subgroup]MCG9620682.1 restriction endonuclease [Vibrio diabolicus]MCR9988582.1 restriction endonuclease [Vibrio antiquarius]